LGQIGIHHLERITSGKTEKRINEIPNACEIAFVHADERGKWMKSGWKLVENGAVALRFKLASDGLRKSSPIFDLFLIG